MATYTVSCPCCTPGGCDLCAVVNANSPPACADECMNLCGTISVTGGFFGDCTIGDYSITFTPGMVDGDCGWRGTVTHDDCTFYLGIRVVSAGYEISGYSADYTSLLGSEHITGSGGGSFTCAPIHMDLLIPDDTSGYTSASGCESRACIYSLSLDPCEAMSMTDTKIVSKKPCGSCLKKKGQLR